jgi:hypothetical protein
VQKKKADPLVSRTTTKKKAQTTTATTPAVRLDRRATTHSKTDTTKSKKTAKAKKTATAKAQASSKIKSAEIVHSSDEESDVDAEGEPASPPATSQPRHAHPSNASDSDIPHSNDSDEDAEGEEEDADAGGLEIEVPDAPTTGTHKKSLASIGFGRSYLSPSTGPRSFASAASSVEGSPNPSYRNAHAARGAAQEEDVIDFGDVGGHHDDDDAEGEDEDVDMDGDVDAEGEAEEEEGTEDRDVEPMDIGPPAQHAPSRKMSVGGAAMEEDEDDMLKLLEEGFAEEGVAGESSEESEEE